MSNNMEKYYVIENRNVGTVGNPKLVETVLFSGTQEECVAYENAKRKEYKDRITVDCYVQSETDRNKILLVNEYWNTLTDEEKKETITVNGKTYNKALYNFHNGKLKRS